MASQQGRHPHRSNRRRPVRHGVFAVALGLVALDVVLAMVARAETPGQSMSGVRMAADPTSVASRAASEPPRSLEDIAGWIDYKNRRHLAALPDEARLLYRRGMLLHESGSIEEAMRHVRGAAELDPSYVAPHLTLASWNLTRDPSQALLQYAAVLDLARRDFAMQLALAANFAYGGLQALLLGLLALGLMIVVAHHGHLRHAVVERLQAHLTPFSATVWSWAVLVLPLAAGLGVAAPTVGLLALLWPHLKVRERTVLVLLAGGLAAAPFVQSGLDRLCAPLRADRGPLYAIPLLERQPWTAARRAEVEALAGRHPDNPWVRFAAGWMARRGGDLAGAEAHYRRAAELAPSDARAMSNLGIVVAMQGRADEAIVLFQRAVERDPRNAAAQFNASQLYTQRFDYQAASDALARASAIDFDLVKTYQARGTEDGMLALVDQWMDPDRMWAATLAAPSAAPSQAVLPPSWRGRIETAGVAYSAVVLACLAVGLAVGLRFQRSMPLRSCSNCGRIVCRRCSRRRRELALCPTCATVEQRAESPDFARMLLLQERRRHLDAHHLVRTGVATLIPGYGLVTFRRVGRPLLLLSITALLLLDAFGSGPPFSWEPRLATDPTGLPLIARAVLWIGVYALSITGYFSHVSRAAAEAAAAAAPIKSRARQVSRRVDAQAA